MTRARLPVPNPRTGQPDHHITPLSAPEIQSLAARLRTAQPAWAALPADARAAALLRLAQAIAAHAPAIQSALEADTGRRRIAALEVETVIAMLRRWAARAPAILADSQTTGQTAMPGVTWRTTLSPYPLIGVIAPWNFPLILSLTDAVPALAAGCAALIKPSEVTPRFLVPLMAAIATVPEIATVLALVEGDGETGAALVNTVDFIAFTGSVATGRKVGEAAARAFIPASLELGGKDPMIILESADPQWAAKIALSASVRATGQACQSIERIYVAAAIEKPFLDALVKAAQAVTLNHPDINSGDLGPFIFARQAEIVQSQINDAVADGAKIHTGGTVEMLGGGHYLRPTILTHVTHAMRIMREESFGPILPVIAFQTPADAIRQANDSQFGLSAAVLAATLEEAESIAIQLNAGAISLNDGALTSLISDAEKSSFALSGLGPSRMGSSGLTRYLRKRALLRQSGTALPLGAFSEAAPK